MSAKRRFLEHMKEKGALPENFDCGGMTKGYAMGGEVEGDEWEDGDWNDHDDSSGESKTYGSNYMKEYAFGGRINGGEHGETSPESLHGHDYGRPNFKGPKEHDQMSDGVSDEEVKRHLAQSLMRRKQLSGISR